MTCDDLRAELIAYHFGTVAPELRDAVEAHLAACAACVREFIAVKRALETSVDEAPSPAARARIRRSIANELRAPAPAWRWWERPLAFGVATAAVVLTVSIAQLLWLAPGAAPHAAVRGASTHLRAP